MHSGPGHRHLSWQDRLAASCVQVVHRSSDKTPLAAGADMLCTCGLVWRQQTRIPAKSAVRQI